MALDLADQGLPVLGGAPPELQVHDHVASVGGLEHGHQVFERDRERDRVLAASVVDAGDAPAGA